MKPTPAYRKMKATMALSALVLGLVAATQSVHAQAVDTGVYTQNFDGMGTAGTSAPTGWSVLSEAGSHDTFSYFQDTTAGSPTAGVTPNVTAGALSLESTLTAGAATNQKGLIGYNFGTTATTSDRALGTSPSGNAATVIELSLINTSGSAINALNLSYDIDRFTTTVNNNTQFSTSPTSTVEENPGYWLYYTLNGGTSWTNVSALNPTLSGTSGVVVPNTVGTTSITNDPLTLSGTWANNGNLEFAWVDDNAQGPSPDQLIGLNNVSIAAVPEPSSIDLGLIAMAFATVLIVRRRRSELV